MKKKDLILSFSIFILLLFAGCASYTPSLVKLDPSGQNLGKEVKGDLCIYVEEYATQEKCQKAFDTDLADEGVLPLLILVQNNGQQSYEVKIENITLRDGLTSIKALTPEETAGKAKRGAVGRALGWSMIVPIISIPIAIAASADHTSKVNKQIVEDFKAKSFQEGIIIPNKEQSGFLFFQMDKERKNLSSLLLEMRARNIVTGEVVTITASLPEATFKTKKVDSQEDKGGDVGMKWK